MQNNHERCCLDVQLPLLIEKDRKKLVALRRRQGGKQAATHSLARTAATEHELVRHAGTFLLASPSCAS